LRLDDLNDDGFRDLVVTDDRGAVWLLLSNKAGRYYGPYEVAGLETGLLRTDFNGDGRPDLAVLSRGGDRAWLFLSDRSGTLAGGTVTLLVGDGTGNLTNVGTFAAEGLAEAVRVEDFNSDGFADLAVTDRTGAVWVLVRRQDGSYHAPLETGDLASSLVRGDF